MEPIPRATIAAANAKSRKLRELVRAPEILVMPGAYDVLSALLFEQLGFKAIQGTSGGIAAALGYPDGEVMSRDLTVEITGKIVEAVSVPVNADAGGACVFFMHAVSRETISRLVKEVKAPVSVLAGPQTPSVSELHDLGVARVSYGSAFMKAAIGATRRLAQEIRDKGTISSLKEGMQTPEIAALVARKKAQ